MKLYLSNTRLSFKSLLLITSLLIFLTSCEKKEKETPFTLVDTFIGTGGHGHTYPGATVPFGFVQLSPDTRKNSWDGCSGYHISDSIIYGFSHTHLSGTGIGDYGDIRLFPSVGKIKTDVYYDENYVKGYGSHFLHSMEKSDPGYYAVYMGENDIYASLTATEHSGFHKYMFPNSDSAHILLDLVESVVSERINGSQIKIINDSTIGGYRHTTAWANDQYLYFYAEFSRPFKSWGIEQNGVKSANLQSSTGGNLKAWFNFDTDAKEIVLVKLGISSVDIEGAKNNLQQEIPHWDFSKTRAEARNKWEDELGRITVKGGSKEDRQIFYTAMYHSFVAPNISSDIDGRYRGHDKMIHQSADFKMHTVFSLWDTFRALHPLFTIVQREKTEDLVNSMLEMYDHDNLLPVWELAACETNCMIGYNAVPVIADAYAKGIRNFDASKALKAMQASANSGQFGLEWYTTRGYIPADKESESVSKTLEYAYDDWCIAEMANMLGEQETYDEFIKRAQYYKNIYDPSTGFFRGKKNGRFVQPFDPTEVNFMLTEANTWQYNFFVPQDINTHINMLGGDDAYESKLDSLFNTKMEISGRHQSDITGLIGQYAHGNEPSHHMAYLYNYVGKPWKTQRLVRQIMRELYTNKPDGLSGNEDCGQMSAWYVLSSMGFYPVCPGTDKYVLGSPVFESITIKLENSKTFKIICNNNDRKNIYIQNAIYNGNPWTKSYITHQMIMDGGELILEMGSNPDKSWGQSKEDRPFQKISDNQITPNPSFAYSSKTFEKEMDVEIVEFPGVDKTRFKVKKKKKFKNEKKYKKPINIEETSEISAYSIIDGVESFSENTKLIKIPGGRKIQLSTEYNSQYTGGGDIALINMLRGFNDFRTGEWQGYHGVNIEAVIDLGKIESIKELGIGFLQDENSWIFMPEYVDFEVSMDNKSYEKLDRILNDVDPKATGGIIKEFTHHFKLKKQIRYIKVKAKNRGVCPEWHKGKGGTSWIFADEVWVK